MNPENKAISNPLLADVDLNTLLYETRVIIMIETAPQSNKYKQLMVTREHFKKISDTILNDAFIQKMVQPPGADFFNITLKEDTESKLPTEIQTHYPLEEIKRHGL